MNVLVACEFSGRVRDAFARRGHYAVSCDLLDSESPGEHIKGDVLHYIDDGWDLIVAFPPCTDLAASGARHWPAKRADGRQAAAVEFVQRIWAARCPRVAVENPIGYLSTAFRKPSQIVQPWMFGHGETKATCLWLRELAALRATEVVEGRRGLVWRMPQTADRWLKRSRTYLGVADAMAAQWGGA